MYRTSSFIYVDLENMKLVIFNIMDLSSIIIYEKRDLKKYWYDNFPFHCNMENIIYNIFGKYYRILIWNGTNDEYLIFKLSEPENRIITQFDLDIDKLNNLKLLEKEYNKKHITIEGFFLRSRNEDIEQNIYKNIVYDLLQDLFPKDFINANGNIQIL